jgi:hypothetical protein
MFRVLIAHPQEALVYCMRIMSVDYSTVAGMWYGCVQPYLSQPTLYARNIPKAVCAAPPEGEQLMLETCRGL